MLTYGLNITNTKLKENENNADDVQTTCYYLLVQLAMQEKRHYGSGRSGKMAAGIT